MGRIPPFNEYLNVNTPLQIGGAAARRARYPLWGQTLTLVILVLSRLARRRFSKFSIPGSIGAQVLTSGPYVWGAVRSAGRQTLNVKRPLRERVCSL